MEKTYLEQKHASSEITFSSIFKGNPKRNMKEAFEEAEKIKVSQILVLLIVEILFLMEPRPIARFQGV